MSIREYLHHKQPLITTFHGGIAASAGERYLRSAALHSLAVAAFKALQQRSLDGVGPVFVTMAGSHCVVQALV